MDIKSTSSCINDVSMGFLWALAFFLEPLGCSLVLLLWVSSGLYAYGICVSLLVSCPSPYSIETSYVSVYFSSKCTCSVVSIVVHSMRDDPCVEPRWDGFFILFLFLMGVLSPSWRCVVFFLVLALFVPTFCVGTFLSYVHVHSPGTVFGIVGTSYFQYLHINLQPINFVAHCVVGSLTSLIPIPLLPISAP
jgi:hypothetical protein